MDDSSKPATDATAADFLPIDVQSLRESLAPQIFLAMFVHRVGDFHKWGHCLEKAQKTARMIAKEARHIAEAAAAELLAK